MPITEETAAACWTSGMVKLHLWLYGARLANRYLWSLLISFARRVFSSPNVNMPHSFTTAFVYARISPAETEVLSLNSKSGCFEEMTLLTCEASNSSEMTSFGILLRSVRAAYSSSCCLSPKSFLQALVVTTASKYLTDFIL